MSLVNKSFSLINCAIFFVNKMREAYAVQKLLTIFHKNDCGFAYNV